MAKYPSSLHLKYGDVPEETHLPDIMLAREVAAYLRLSLKSVYTMARAQQIPSRSSERPSAFLARR
jgi:hypothetical protein